MPDRLSAVMQPLARAGASRGILVVGHQGWQVNVHPGCGCETPGLRLRLRPRWRHAGGWGVPRASWATLAPLPFGRWRACPRRSGSRAGTVFASHGRPHRLQARCVPSGDRWFGPRPPECRPASRIAAHLGRSTGLSTCRRALGPLMHMVIHIIHRKVRRDHVERGGRRC